MKKWIKRAAAFAVCIAAAFVLVRFGPGLYERFFGEGDVKWVSERFSEALREKNELIVYEVEATGQETVTQEAWLLGTVQKVEMPYTFQMRFVVDLSRAVVTAEGNTVEVRVPPPAAAYPKLTVDEANVHKSDWLYPLTPERYTAICRQTEERLFGEYAANEEYRANAWNTAVHDLERLFGSLTDGLGRSLGIRVICDDALTAQPEAA